MMKTPKDKDVGQDGFEPPRFLQNRVTAGFLQPLGH